MDQQIILPHFNDDNLGVLANDITNLSQSDIGENPYINLATGRLRYVFNDLSIGHGNYGIGIGHVYLSKVNNAFTSKFGEFGKGWKLNVSQCIEKDGDDILYFDDKGETHRFVPFTTSRYYDERNAKVTLQIENGEYVITDGVSNKLRFNLKGYLTQSISCHNDAICKVYEYDTQNRLTTVYDSRNKIGSTVNRRIALEYDKTGRLCAMTAYGKNARKLDGLKYEYDTDGNLIAVRKVAYNNTDRVLAEIQTLEMSYNANGYLETVADCETKDAFKLEYTTDRITKMHSGCIKESAHDGLTLNMHDSSANALALGMTECATKATYTFVPLAHNAYSYNFDYSDGISVRTDVTNDKDITLSYFIDRNACITSSFEKAETTDGKLELKTLTKQRAKTKRVTSPNANVTINGIAPSCSSNGAVYFDLSQYDIARNQAEQNYKHFIYSFWLKTEQVYSVLEARLNYTFTNYSFSNTKVFVNPKAKGAWQKVSIPLHINNSCSTQGLDSIAISLIADEANKTSADSFEIISIGFSPSMASTAYLATSSTSYIPFDTCDKFKYNNTEYTVSAETYFTESDLIATLTNRYKDEQAPFDIICNNGEKRIANAGDIYFHFPTGEWSDFWNKTPIEIRSITPTDNTFYTYYGFNLDEYGVYNGIFLKTKGVNDNGTSSSACQVISYKGNILAEVDEYGIQTKYYYDNYGNLTDKIVSASDGTIGSQIHYSYDGEGRLRSASDGYSTQKFAYDARDNLLHAVDTATADQPETYRSAPKQDVFNNATIANAEFLNNELISQNKVTYENGRLRTVTDGLATYGIKHTREPSNQSVEYTQINGANETTLQKDSIVGTKHTSEYVTGGKIVTSVDKYGRILEIEKTDQDENRSSYQYAYDDIYESDFAAVPSRRSSATDNTLDLFEHDDDGNLTGFGHYKKTADGYYKILIRAQQIEENTTRYNFKDDWQEYYTSIQYDPDKALNPRITAVKNMWYRDADTNYSVQDRRLFCQLYEYDNLSRIKKAQCADYFSYSYDYGYDDARNLLTNVQYRNTMRFRPDVPLDNLVSNITQDESLEYYNNRDLKRTVQHYSYELPFANSSDPYVGSGTTAKEYKYDGARRLKQDILTITRNSATYKTTCDYTYRKDGRLQRIDKTTDYKFANGTIGTQDRTFVFTYDRYGRLTTLNDGTSNPINYYYDDYGNRRRQNRTNNEGSQEYYYKYGNQLSKVVSKGITSLYTYNADGVRTSKTVGGVKTDYYLDGNKLLREQNDSNTISYLYGKDGLIGCAIKDQEYLYVKDAQGNITMLLCRNDPTKFARYEYDSFGYCTVFDGTGQVRTDPTFMGNINPFRWKGFYYDTETELYYANGSYYDPATGLYVDAAPMPTILDNALSNRSLDRNAPMCNNILELAGNPHTVFTEEKLFADPNYNPESKLPDWLQKRHKRQRKLAEALQKLNDLHWGIKLAIGIALLIGAIVLTYVTGGGGLGILQVILDVIVGVRVGITMWAIGTILTGGKLTLEGLGNAALDSFVVSSAIAFVCAGVTAIKYAYRSKPHSSPKPKQLQFESQAQLDAHFNRHGSQFGDMYKTAQDYLQGANNVIANGVYNTELNGYTQFYRVTSKGKNLYHFVGLKNGGTYISTYFPRVL